jgi:hypothetical protein
VALEGVATRGCDAVCSFAPFIDSPRPRRHQEAAAYGAHSTSSAQARAAGDHRYPATLAEIFVDGEQSIPPVPGHELEGKRLRRRDIRTH